MERHTGPHKSYRFKASLSSTLASASHGEGRCDPRGSAVSPFLMPTLRFHLHLNSFEKQVALFCKTEIKLKEVKRLLEFQTSVMFFSSFAFFTLSTSVNVSPRRCVLGLFSGSGAKPRNLGG